MSRPKFRVTRTNDPAQPYKLYRELAVNLRNAPEPKSRWIDVVLVAFVALAAFLLVSTMFGCALPHVDPRPRTMSQAELAAVTVEVSCGEDYGAQRSQHIDWTNDRAASGVLISERHVLTAAHAVSCPALPKVHVTLSDGRRFRAVVERDDATFGAGRDLARLVLMEDTRFGIAPPALASPDGTFSVNGDATAFLGARGARGARSYVTGWYSRGTIAAMPTQHGDSGSGVYVRGKLVGIVSASGELTNGQPGTRIEIVTADWLEGT